MSATTTAPIAQGGRRPAEAQDVAPPSSPARAPSRGAASTVTDDELTIVARVAQREGWADPRRPPASHGPRSLGEALAISRFEAAARGRTAPAERPSIRRRLWAWVVMIAIGVVGLGVCWYVSPGRTLAGIVGVGLFCLLAAQRSRRRGRRPGRPRGPLGGL